ncbi:MarR family winged helix-turn-helix transcriptional regulator [Budvicia diplopodorum]|uniref:MarR family winged helix-turn-helix transcriptional regulator n=1 Tax=Budvicia diplopodorum TaxID=1119056 RepID=UPI00135B81D5|nr:MarR family transcriptional regulator [Budvicia diplopodorum]
MTLFDILERLANLQQSGFRRNSLLESLPSVQVNALYYLLRCNHYSNTPGSVTEYLGLTKGTVSQSLRKLEEKALIYRQSHPGDKRKVLLFLTDKARQAIEGALSQDNIAKVQSALPSGGEELQLQLMGLLRQVQLREGVRLFGECQFCRFHQRQQGQSFCRLTQELLPSESITLICREFESQ